MKVIPAIDLMNGQVVRLYKGDPKLKTVYDNDPVKIAKKWEADGADMLHLVDLDATLGIGSNIEIMNNIQNNNIKTIILIIVTIYCHQTPNKIHN